MEKLGKTARSPWENGRTERAGGIFKTRLEGALHEVGATTEEELKLTIQEVVTAHNRFYNRTGFTPYQRAVTGRAPVTGALSVATEQWHEAPGR